MRSIKKNKAKLDTYLEQLQTSGNRITNVRKAILQILIKTKAPIAVNDIIKQLESVNLFPNKTTVYREMEFLVANNFINEIDLLEGQKRYELRDEAHRHHHLLCLICKNVICIDTHSLDLKSDIEKLQKKIQSQYNFKVQKHILEFFGMCDKCAG
jgi:Fur family transcriptional regulator, ferric uptake regulator